MTTYRYNTETQEFIEDNNNLGASFYQDPWRKATEQEVLDYTLSNAKQNKIQEIKAECANRVFQPVAYKNTYFKATQIASSNIMGGLLLGFDTVEWLDTQEYTVMLTKAELMELGMIISQQYNAVYKQESHLIQMINNTNSIDEINQIVWE